MNESCPCKKRKCERRGDCEACRAHHAQMKRQRPVACEKNVSAALNRNENGEAPDESETVATMTTLGLL